MECKDKFKSFRLGLSEIRIYPEWTVKEIKTQNVTKRNDIRIYPEWNVKKDLAKVLFPGGELEYIQNGM